MQVVLAVTGVYLVIGLIFAAGFVTAGVGRLDAVARGSPGSFRALIFPGATALWPLLLLMLLRQRTER